MNAPPSIDMHLKLGKTSSHVIKYCSLRDIVLQFANMSYPTNILLYEDEPAGWKQFCQQGVLLIE